MKQFFPCFLITFIFLNFCHADVFGEKYDKGIEEIRGACDGFKQKEFNSHFCDLYLNLKKEVSSRGERFAQKILEVIPFTDTLAVTGFMLKAVVDKKIEIDPKIKDFGKPKLEIKPQEVSLKMSYDF